MKKSGQLIFIDDSGDPGFKGATSNHFIMASVVFVDHDAATKANEAISNFRKALGWQDETEFKFRKTNKHIIKQLLNLVYTYDFQVYAVYVDKSDYKQMPPAFSREKLYNRAIKELLSIIPMDAARIKIDGRSNRGHRMHIASYLRHKINIDNHKIKTIKHEDSKKDNLIQLADLVAGAINRSLQSNKTDADVYLAIFNKKVAKIQPLNLDN